MNIQKEKPETFQNNYRSDINGIRAVAVIAVILNHFDRSVLPLGYLGVDIFFVISGFVITSSIHHRRKGGLIDFWVAFYSRRFKRLFPALAGCVLITSILICLVDPNPGSSLRTGVASLFGLSNIHMFRQATDYFGSQADLNAFTQTWSLGVEEQFYLLFPIAVWATGYLRAPVRASKPFIVVFTIAIAASIIFYGWSVGRSQPAAFFLLPSRLWELGTGVLLFAVTAPESRITRLARLIPSSLILMLLVGFLFLKVDNDFVATIVVVGLSALLIAGLRPRTPTYALLTLPFMSFLGKISYSLYLWHWTVICLSRWTIGLSWWLAPLQFMLMLVLATASHTYLETPLRRAQWSNSRVRSGVYGLAAMSGVVLALLALQGPVRELLFLGAKSTEEALAQPLLTLPAQPRGTLLLVGDSHADHLGPMVRDVSTRFHLHPLVISKGASPFPAIPISSPSGGLTIGRNRVRSADMLRQVETSIAALDRSESNLIVLSSFYRYYFETRLGRRQREVKTHYNATGEPIVVEEALENWLDRLKAFAAAHPDLHIIIILSTPEMPNIHDQALCKKEWFRPHLSETCEIQMDRKDMVATLAPLNARIVAAVASLPNVAVFDPLPALCPEWTLSCHSQDGDQRLFADEDHLTVAGARKVGTAFGDFLLGNRLVPRVETP